MSIDVDVTANSDVEITVVSDLHIGAGRRQETASFSRHEEFFYDVEFSLFVDHLIQNSKTSGKPHILVLNGDVMDFLSVTDVPVREEIESMNIPVTRNEMKFGLGSSENKALWKTRIILKGHSDFFMALARFLMEGHRVVYIRGNHDLEIYWEKVKTELETFLKNCLIKLGSTDGSEISGWEVRQWFFFENGVYIEHGNQYDETNVITSPLCPLLPDGAYGGKELLLDYPVGSLFARFVYGPIRGLDPYRTHVISLAQYLSVMRTYNLWDFIRTLHLNFPFFLRAIRNSLETGGTKAREFLKRHIIERKTRAQLAGINEKQLKKIDSLRALPLGHSGYEIFIRMFRPFLIQMIILFFLVITSIFGWILTFTTLSSILSHSVFGKASTISVLAVLTFVGIFFLFAKIGKAIYSYEDPLIINTRKNAGKISEIIKPRVIVMGHTHVCEKVIFPNGCIYINTGTWIPYPGPWDLLKQRARQFTFCRISSDNYELLQWDPVLRLPVPPLILENSRKNPWEKVIGDDFIPPEEKN
ncbi:MAG: metallophosphoesterase [Deltaproteobacteria bacterium]|nr:metallophosphoesterase [Deltaproteobacteria bacterium]